jgi:DNA replication protein DnaC
MEEGVIPPGEFKYGGTMWPCDCAAQIALLQHYMAAGIPYKYMRYDDEDWKGDKKALEEVHGYLDGWDKLREFGIGLGFHAKTLGVGKTFLATYIGRELIKRGELVAFSNFNDVLSVYELPYEPRQKREDLLKSSRVLILDEVSQPWSEAQAPLYAAKFEDLIRHRTNFNKATIYTTNMEPDVLDRLFPRAYSLLSSNSRAITVNGSDVRRESIWDIDYELLKNGEVRPIC